jgi:GTP-binding protein EngB required for normal cell division
MEQRTERSPDDEAAARTKAIEYFHIEAALQFRVVATKLDKVTERA